ncbi:DUF2269 family protein [Virgibacillus sp. 179-BFC.A HS]|uniref:DUF2269 family protein n=1 Tax=Tigheibacillus jepli TaxID=3035914 RepID=A0ABU5CMN5_9BACI|nr:DUF2269 family protein [Virgibacillus sp. 179-BFC.A HS]MDY0406703.1 DUF2269 family protein [Virgibacillus sp. 179-BFC.A HS]
MYSFIVFAHVLGALLIGSFLAFPFAFKSLLSQSGNEVKVAVKTLVGFTRFAHYALILLIVTGGWMAMGYATYPSLLWVMLSLILFMLIGALIGVIQHNLKRVIFAEDPDNALQRNKAKLNTLGWFTFVLIFTVVFVMTNRGLFS